MLHDATVEFLGSSVGYAAYTLIYQIRLTPLAHLEVFRYNLCISVTKNVLLSNDEWGVFAYGSVKLPDQQHFSFIN
ncbi:hypothetical protein [Paenibacillus sp. FSL K6-2524]|uniref:hypothetical protein n=1 Tax=Paenibacillus sp. FSL K6-2524 TaxID=2954516 RepID=UPI0030FCF71B